MVVSAFNVRSSECLNKGHSSLFHTMAHCVLRDSQFHTPVFDALRLVSNGNENGASGVAHLDSSGYPPAVSWEVPEIVVDSFQFQAIRPIPHVCDKSLEGSPGFAHSDPAATIVAEVFAIRIGAALNHARPSGVGRGAGLSPARLPVTETPSLPAPATTAAATEHALDTDVLQVPAVALEFPKTAGFPILDKPHGCEGPKLLTRDVFALHASTSGECKHSEGKNKE